MSSNQVQTGIWHNNSNPGAYATSLTIDVRTGAFLIAGLATFVTMVGGRFWAIVAFAIHQLRTTPADRDGIYHQQQAIYRNTSTGLGVIWLLLRVTWAWRGLAERNALCFFAFALPPLLCFAAFVAASVLSARVAAPSYAASAVRVRPENCGFLAFPAPDDPQYNGLLGEPAYGKWSNMKSREATNYARTCSGNSSSALTACNIFPVRALPYKTRTDAPCPFKGGRCALGENGAFELETQWIDSHQHLGINAIPSDRIFFRKATACSVIKIDDLTESYQSAGFNVFNYHLGPGGANGGGIASANSTYRYLESAQNPGFSYMIRYILPW
jgi:hypothetical protein